MVLQNLFHQHSYSMATKRRVSQEGGEWSAGLMILMVAADTGFGNSILGKANFSGAGIEPEGVEEKVNNTKNIFKPLG